MTNRRDLFITAWLTQHHQFKAQELADVLKEQGFKHANKHHTIRILHELRASGIVSGVKLYDKTGAPHWHWTSNIYAQAERSHIPTPLLHVEQPSLISPSLDLRDPITFNEEG